jgi:hypothetical protein
MTAVIHLNTAAACSTMEREKPEVACLLNAIDLDRKAEPDVEVPDNFEDRVGHFRDEMDAEGILLLRNGRSAGAQEVCVLPL